jgi:hypothetical protein
MFYRQAGIEGGEIDKLAIKGKITWMPKWRNWQTRYVQGVVGFGPCGFKSHLRHSIFLPAYGDFLY